MSDKKLLLVGAGGFGRMASELASQQYECAFVDDVPAVGAKVCGIPVVGRISNLSNLRSKYDLLIVCIGNNKFRMQVYKIARELNYAFPNIIAPSAYISPFAKIGQGCVVLQNACIQNGSAVGDGVLINAGAEVHCDAKVGDYALIYTIAIFNNTAKSFNFCERVV